MKLLILSDIHGNWPALEAVLKAEKRFSAVVFCGDVVDYGPQPGGCLRWLIHNATHVVRGNHDNALGFDVDCRCTGSFREYSVATRAWHRTLLSKGDLDYLRQMPTVKDFQWRKLRFHAAHATPQGDLFEYLAADQWGERLGPVEADFVLLGHTHVQGMRRVGNVTVLNPGSVGLARDHRGRACYAVCEDGEVTLKQIPYDVDRTATALQAAPLPEAVIRGLRNVLGRPV